MRATLARQPEPEIVDEVESASEAIGALLLQEGHLTQAQLEQVLIAQKRRRGRFGELAVKLKFVSQQAIDAALARQFSYHAGLAHQRERLPEVLVSAREPGAPFAESMRALRGQLAQRWFTGSPHERAMALASVDPGDGKSFVCANLAVAFSQLGERTLLIDANLRDPSQHHFFRLRERMGLSGVLAGRAGLSQVRRIQDLPGLSVLPAGATPPNPQELLAGNAFRRLLTELSQHFGVILIDTPAAQTASDVHGVAVRAGAALLLARKHHTRVPELARLSGDFATAGVNVLGSTMNEY